jgi:uncharacterized secreted protein with C-terminal beta-propeller domain
MVNFLKKKIEGKIALAIFIGVFLIAVLAIWILYKNLEFKISWPKIPSVFQPKVEGIKKFASEEEFKSYLKEAEAAMEYFGWEMGLERGMGMPVPAAPLMEGKLALLPERVSETTVQVPGIDEPDIVKTDGREIYFSPGRTWLIWREPIIMEGKIIPPSKETKTKIIKAFPPTELKLDSEIEKSGDLLLVQKDILVIFSGQDILGYDVSNPQAPQKKWEIKLEEKNSIVSSRFYQNKIYLVTKNLIDEIHPCPIKPLIIEEKTIEISCQEIYHPILPVPIDVTFLVMVLDPISGKIENKISFVGSSGQSVVYMSEKAIYITYSYYESIVKFFSQFLRERCQDLIPNWVLEKLEKLEGYDISQQAKLLQIQMILEKYQNSLSGDERLRVENELTNRMPDYYKEKKRELEKSGILKIDLEKFEIIASDNVPGYPLNQFALDEYQENLRIAVTVGERFAWFGFGPSGGESANDVYVLDKNLKILGKIQDLGLTERIYSARFIEDKGYLVTFRQTDPFYVLDLSNPRKPELKGELKIPGYSSYLHPISKDKILGIGKENWQVKISLFDVTLPENPKELDKYILDESWSDILSTHHAFLIDKKYQIFFLPGSRGGYVFTYQNDKLSLLKAVSEISARRAIYINDYLYIIGDKKITVLNEIDWQKVKELEI